MIEIIETSTNLDTILEWGNKRFQDPSYISTSKWFLNLCDARIFEFSVDGMLAGGLATISGLSPHYGYCLDTMVVINPEFENNKELSRSILEQIKYVCNEMNINVYSRSKHLTSSTDLVSYHILGGKSSV